MTDKNTNKKLFHIGQTIWFKPFERRDTNFKDDVITIGRKYITTKRHLTIDIETLRWVEKGYGTQGRIFFSEQELKDYEQTKINIYRIRKIVDEAYREGTMSLNQTKNILNILEAGRGKVPESFDTSN